MSCVISSRHSRAKYNKDIIELKELKEHVAFLKAAFEKAGGDLPNAESGDAGHDDDNQDASSECSEQVATANGKAKKAAPAAAAAAEGALIAKPSAAAAAPAKKTAAAPAKTATKPAAKNKFKKVSCYFVIWSAVAKADIVIKVLSWVQFKYHNDLKKTDGNKRGKLNIPKFEEANFAAANNSDKCTLILTERDSTKALALSFMSALSVVGEDYYVVFPLKGKLLNVREASPKQLQENAEIQNIKNNVGLQYGCTRGAFEKILARYASNDPATFEAMKEAIKVAHEAANRWTICTYCCEMISGFSINMDEHAPFAPLATSNIFSQNIVQFFMMEADGGRLCKIKLKIRNQFQAIIDLIGSEERLSGRIRSIGIEENKYEMPIANGRRKQGTEERIKEGKE
ncbi:hypothetical protein L2E82_06470 [Cichorium intybus]|uniref:Uncharacterized protein n=1 Tax=Cichorium intybus TaxID=13427 RepID=A0ACB9HAK4_CICIN|nr:hypothetical protein L2E82_06470 [Cichorium intybus]